MSRQVPLYLLAAAIFLTVILPRSGAQAARPTNLLRNGLDAWEIRGDGIWFVRSDGVLVGYRRPDEDGLFAGQDTISKQRYQDWRVTQSWLYTREEFEEFDLRFEYWIRVPGNSGISLWDPGRAEEAIKTPPTWGFTPSQVAYEIQVNSQWGNRYPSGSVYSLSAAPEGLQRDGEWNTMRIVARRDGITTYLNGAFAAQHPGVPGRPTSGPIGFQLHDQSTLIMFRNIVIDRNPAAPSPARRR